MEKTWNSLSVGFSEPNANLIKGLYTTEKDGSFSTLLCGRGNKLGMESEMFLADHLKTMAKNRTDLSEETFLDLVKDYVEQNSLAVPIHLKTIDLGITSLFDRA